MSEKFKIAWNAFSWHRKEHLRNLLETHEFSDVTLITDDNHHYNVHKFVLSACSPVFRKIFLSNHLNSLIYLRGIYHIELESILQFIYLGETTFSREKIDELLSVAKSLDITEIGESITEEDEIYEQDNDTEDPFVKDEPVTVDETIVSADTASDEDSKDINRSLRISLKKNHKTICKVCNQEFNNREERDKHAEETGHHLQFSCGICGQSFKQKIHASRHEAQIHSEEMPYKCSRCDKKFKNEFSWKRHQENDAIHHMTKKIIYHECEVCGKQFDKKRKWLFDQHMRTHKLEVSF